jgi:two-component system response regulator EvgA
MNSRILIIDDHPAVRMSIRLLLQGDGYSVIGEADNGADAIRQILDLRPGIIILDIGLPNIDGLTIMSRLVAQKSPVKVIVFTAQDSDHIAIRCAQAGAQGFVTKHSQLEELLEAVNTVKNGYNFFPDRVTTLVRRDESHDSDAALLGSLSIRELWVLQQLALGMTNKQVAERMRLSSKTVSTYKTRLLVKLNASNVLDLYNLAKRNGLAEC